MLPSELESAIRNCLSGRLNTPITSFRSQAVGGGSINYTYRLDINNSLHFFCKVNLLEKFTDLFLKEKRGIELISEKNAIRVPKIIDCFNAGFYQVLILEWVDEGLKTEKFWKSFGEQLARLHHETNSFFGLDHDNYMGALCQRNKKNDSWIDFLIHERLAPQVELAFTHHLLEANQVEQFENVFKQLVNIFPPEAPSFLHGDLWSGNFMVDADGNPVLIDPAVYWGHRSMDLAMTTLFGGFDNIFYEAYNHYYRFPENYREQWEICNLYPLLIHLNLFGKSYLHDIAQTIKQY